ncbi:MAG TPA: carbohydrate ABC transporter permease [Nitrospiraceae bacterium]|nr:carbohydrate ABC transporter permease [Nitrospiraceae bacterium]
MIKSRSQATQAHPVRKQIGPAIQARPRQRSEAICRVAPRIALHGLLVVLSIFVLLPLFSMVTTSLKSIQQIGAIPPQWIPRPAHWENYPNAMTYVPVLLYVTNTLYITVFRVVGVLVSSSVVAYGFARIRWPGRDAVFFIVLATMMVPYQVTMVPLYIIFSKLGWVGSYKPLIVPAFFGLPFFIFLLRQFFSMNIPDELCDSARVDGCSELGIFLRIFVPLSKPVLLTVALFETVWDWNEFLTPLIYITDMNKFTVALGLSLFSDQHHWQWGLLMGATTMSIIPIVVFFFVVQRAFVQGITFTGMKG